MGTVSCIITDLVGTSSPHREQSLVIMRQIQFIFMDYIDAELIRRLWTYEAFYLVFLEFYVFEENVIYHIS